MRVVVVVLMIASQVHAASFYTLTSVNGLVHGFPCISHHSHDDSQCHGIPARPPVATLLGD